MMTLLKFHELWKPVLVMIIVNLALAFVNIFLKKVLNEGVDYLTIVTYRQAISAIFLAPIACFYESWSPSFSGKVASTLLLINF
ncbi:WAT1-related protein, partial [Mucuna pruriens]